MSCNPFYKILEGYEDADLRNQLPEGMDYGETPLVSVWVNTYNHECYLCQCLESIVAQKVSFPIEVIVADDNSTDNNQTIIREFAEKYPSVIKPILGRENIYSKGRKRCVEQFVPLARGKYFACCEGDDYWTYDYKLQKMVDFLEAHSDYSMIFHAFKGLCEVEGLEANFARVPRARRVRELEVIIEPHVHYASFMGRLDIIRNDTEIQVQYGKHPEVSFDMRTYLSLYNAGKVYALPHYWSVYRVQPEGVYTTLRIKNEERVHDLKALEAMQTFYNGKYPNLVSKRYTFIDLRKYLISWTYARKEGKYVKAIGSLLKGFLKHPFLFLSMYFHRYIF